MTSVNTEGVVTALVKYSNDYQHYFDLDNTIIKKKNCKKFMIS